MSRARPYRSPATMGLALRLALRARCERAEDRAAFAEESAFMHQDLSERLQEQMAAAGITSHVGMTPQGRIVDLRPAGPDPALEADLAEVAA